MITDFFLLIFLSYPSISLLSVPRLPSSKKQQKEQSVSIDLAQKEAS